MLCVEEVRAVDKPASTTEHAQQQDLKKKTQAHNTHNTLLPYRGVPRDASSKVDVAAVVAPQQRCCVEAAVVHNLALTVFHEGDLLCFVGLWCLYVCMRVCMYYVCVCGQQMYVCVCV